MQKQRNTDFWPIETPNSGFEPHDFLTIFLRF